MNDERLVRLERQVRTLQVSLVAACCTVGLLGLAAFRSQDSPHILRVRGLIVEDSLGRERILIGAPIPGASRRVRTDTARVARVWGPRFPKSYLQYYKSYRHDMDGDWRRHRIRAWNHDCRHPKRQQGKHSNRT